MGRKTTLAALFAGAVGGAAITTIATAPAAPAQENYTALTPAIEAKAKMAGAKGAVTCKHGVISNHPDRVYCTDGGTAGFLLSDDEAAELGE